MVLATALSAAFLTLIPRRTTWMTELGTATMYIYLLHTFAIYPLKQSGILQSTPVPDLWLAIMITFALAITVILASPLVRRIFRPIIEPKPRWPFLSQVR
jgi:fucose 4-O-acetylase-like acetyltransferase